jgi:hypothetical protein
MFFRKTPRITRVVTLNSGQTLQVTPLNPMQYRRLTAGSPQRSWTKSEADRHTYERWLRTMLPFVTCTIDQVALAQRRIEMAALEVPLPSDDTLAWVAYVCIDDPSDLRSIIAALEPQGH